MFIETPVTPRFCDTDAMGHINNTAVTQWLEMGRMDFMFNHLEKLPNFMVRRIELDYEREMNFKSLAMIRTGVEKIGTSSITLRQEVWQHDLRTAQSKHIEVWFDSETRQSAAIPSWFKEQLKDLMFYE